MKKISVFDYLAACSAWRKDPCGQRLGQYLINTLVPDSVAGEIFYEEDPQKAQLAFYEKFVARDNSVTN